MLASKGSPSLSPYIPQLLLAQLWSDMLIMVRPFLRHFLIFENYTISKASFSNFENDIISNPPFLCHFLFLNLTTFPITDAVIFYFWKWSFQSTFFVSFSVFEFDTISNHWRSHFLFLKMKYAICGSDDPTRIHTLRKYVGQAEARLALSRREPSNSCSH